MKPTRVLFVCLGNICRSPLAECIFRGLARERGVAQLFDVDSAGTSGWHVGNPPDVRSVATARARGVEVRGASRKLLADDLHRFDYVIAMDARNRADILLLRAGRSVEDERGASVHLLREWDAGSEDLDVPDPYYGGPSGFDDVHDMIERSCAALLDHLLEERGASE